MKAAVYYEAGGPEVFRDEEVPDPVIGPDDVLIRVEAVSIEGGDTLHRLRGELAAAPHIVGYQCAGTVLDVGINVAGFTAGDRAVTVGADGSHAELRATRESLCWLIPDGLSTEEAACVPVAFGTADDCLFEFGRLQAGETALIHAGASGVGLAAIQLASRAGARVLATASSDERLRRLREYGLDDGINYASTDFAEAVRHLTGGHGADVIVDSIGGSNLQKSLQCLAYRGRCLTFGDAGRADHLAGWTSRHAPQQPDAHRLLPRRGAARRPAGARRHRPAARRGRGRQAPGRHRPAVPARPGRRGPRLHRKQAGVRPGPAHPLTSLTPPLTSLTSLTPNLPVFPYPLSAGRVRR